MKDNQSSFMVENNYLQIKDYDSIDFDTGEVTNQLAQNEQKIKKIDNVSFWGIEMSRDTCKKIYDTLCRNTDSIFRKLQNSELKLVKMIEQIGNHSFLGFISTFAAKSTKTIKKITKFIGAIPHASKLIQIIFILFGFPIGIIT